MASIAPPDGTRVNILFVDDEAGLLRAMKRILKGAPYDVLTTTRPSEALELLAKHRIDLIVSDIDMPEMNGLELLRIVRREHPNVLRMVLTGAATLDRVLHAVNEGEVVRFFVKPFDSILFREAVTVLADRIERARRDDARAVDRSRGLELESWLARRYPELLDVERAPTGEAVVDLSRVARALKDAGLGALAAVFAIPEG